MIIYPSYRERNARRQEKLGRLYNDGKRIKRFAFFPVKMNDLSWVWLQYVWTEYWINKFDDYRGYRNAGNNWWITTFNHYTETQE